MMSDRESATWTENIFDDRYWHTPWSADIDSVEGEEQNWLWMEPDVEMLACRLNQADYETRQENDGEGFRICNRITSEEDGDHQYSTFFTYGEQTPILPEGIATELSNGGTHTTTGSPEDALNLPSVPSNDAGASVIVPPTDAATTGAEVVIPTTDASTIAGAEVVPSTGAEVVTPADAIASGAVVSAPTGTDANASTASGSVSII